LDDDPLHIVKFGSKTLDLIKAELITCPQRNVDIFTWPPQRNIDIFTWRLSQRRRKQSQ